MIVFLSTLHVVVAFFSFKEQSRISFSRHFPEIWHIIRHLKHLVNSRPQLHAVFGVWSVGCVCWVESGEVGEMGVMSPRVAGEGGRGLVMCQAPPCGILTH